MGTLVRSPNSARLNPGLTVPPVQPPELEILEIGDLSTDRFRGIFRLTYAGDAYIVLQTKVQVRLPSRPKNRLLPSG